MVIATHPTTSAHVVNVRRLLACIPAEHVVVSVSRELSVRLESTVAAFRAARLVATANDRLDTGKWCAGLSAIGGSIKHYRWVVLANDSIFLLRAVPQLFAALASGRYDLAGAVAVSSGWGTPLDESYHVQSYLRAFPRHALRQWQNRSCLLPASHHSFLNKRAIVVYHEIGSSQMFGRNRLFGLFDGDSRALDGSNGKPWHLNLTFWSEAWPRGFPVAKRPQVSSVCPLHIDALNSIVLSSAANSLATCLEAKFGHCSGPT